MGQAGSRGRRPRSVPRSPASCRLHILRLDHDHDVPVVVDWPPHQRHPRQERPCSSVGRGASPGAPPDPPSHDDTRGEDRRGAQRRPAEGRPSPVLPAAHRLLHRRRRGGWGGPVAVQRGGFGFEDKTPGHCSVLLHRGRPHQVQVVRRPVRGGGGATNRGAVGRDGLAAPVAGAIVAGSSSSPAPGTTGAGRPEVERGGVEASPIPAAARVSARLGRRAAGAWPSGPAAEAPATNAATAWFEPPRRGARAELCSAGEEARGREDIVPPMSTLHGLVSPHRPRLRPCLCPPPTPLPLSSPPFPYSVSSPRKMVLSADPLAMTGSVG